MKGWNFTAEYPTRLWLSDRKNGCSFSMEDRGNSISRTTLINVDLKSINVDLKLINADLKLIDVYLRSAYFARKSM